MNASEKPVIRVLTGCTAVGKTELALRWAETHGAEIISCDSLLFYRGMDIGTAKPTRSELARVPHHLVDTNELADQMDIMRYVAQARDIAVRLLNAGRQVLVTGGSGFYLKSFLAPVADGVEVSEVLRQEVRGFSHEEALARLRALNPGGLGALDVANPRRVTRALERCLASGRTLLELKADFDAQPSPFADFDVRLLQLEREGTQLERRVVQRVQQMLTQGLVDEVRALDARGLRDNPSAARAIGYREVIDLLDGRIKETELEALIVANTRALVKKQRTWFKTQLPAHACVHPEAFDVGMTW